MGLPAGGSAPRPLPSLPGHVPAPRGPVQVMSIACLAQPRGRGTSERQERDLATPGYLWPGPSLPRTPTSSLAVPPRNLLRSCQAAAPHHRAKPGLRSVVSPRDRLPGRPALEGSHQPPPVPARRSERAGLKIGAGVLQSLGQGEDRERCRGHGEVCVAGGVLDATRKAAPLACPNLIRVAGIPRSVSGGQPAAVASSFLPLCPSCTAAPGHGRAPALPGGRDAARKNTGENGRGRRNRRRQEGKGWVWLLLAGRTKSQELQLLGMGL